MTHEGAAAPTPEATASRPSRVAEYRADTTPASIAAAEHGVAEAAAELEAARVALAQSLEDADAADELAEMERRLVVTEAEVRLGRAHLALARLRRGA